jgi:hypothetical protein
MNRNEAVRIEECERGLHLIFPGDLVFEVDGMNVCEDCLVCPELAQTA